MYYPNTDHYFNFKLFVQTHLSGFDYNQITWYVEARKACQKMATEYGLELETVVGVVAVTSPNLYWSRNLDVAAKVLKAWANFERPENMRVNAYPENVAKAFDILRNGPKVGVNIRGPKVTAFYENIRTGGAGLPTVDVWMVRVGRSDFRVKIKQSKVTPKQIKAMQAALVKLANELGVLVTQLQAAVWLKAKHLMGSEGGAAWAF